MSGLVFYGTSSKMAQEPSGEELFTALLCMSVRTTDIDALQSCEISGLLDDGESFSNFVEGDDGYGWYRASTTSGSILILQTSGQDFIFTENGGAPEPELEIPGYAFEIQWDSLAKLLVPANSPLANGIYGLELGVVEIDYDLEMIDSDCPRFRLFVNGDPVAGLRVENRRVDGLYVSKDHRRKGYATELFNRVNEVMDGELRHSSTLTADGELFVSSFSERDRAPSIELGAWA